MSNARPVRRRPAPRRTPARHDGGSELDVAGLAAALRGAVAGAVDVGAGARHLYATDASNFRQVPLGVVVPRTIDDVVAAHAVCRAFGAPILTRGAGTSLAGQATNRAVVIDTSRHLDAVVDYDPDGRTVTCQPGVVLGRLQTALLERAPLTWGPDPATGNRCTVGGMIGNNACGMRAFRYGRTSDNVRALDVLLADGTRMTVGATTDADLDRVVAAGGRRGAVHAALRDLRDASADRIRDGFPAIPRRVSGYNLDDLLPERGFHVARALVGSEGTCVTVLHATLDLHDLPTGRAVVVLGFPDIAAAGDLVPWLRREADALAVEGLDGRLVTGLGGTRAHRATRQLLPEGGAWLVVEFGGRTQDEAGGRAASFRSRLHAEVGAAVAARTCADAAERAAIWAARRAALGASSRFAGGVRWPGWEDSAVAPDDLGPYLRDLGALFDRYGYDAAIYGHFGDGCVHARVGFDLATDAGVATYRRFLDEAADLVAGYGGSLSGEHGDGQQRGALLERMYGPELVAAFRTFKAIWDPDGLMNPGKVVDARPPDADLRARGRLRLPVVGRTPGGAEGPLAFAYPDDGGSFVAAQTRCVGVGLCRRTDDAGTMCPSYMVTREERHSTRGRARLLYEMLRSDGDLDGWADRSVHDALELCLSCKGCASDCPVGVDVATYKSEFNHQHWSGRVRPRVHYTLGLIDRWARLATRAPRSVNRLLGARTLGALLKRAAGVTTDRPAPRFATETFRRWSARQPSGPGDGPPVVLFADTFTDHFRPEVGRAAVTVLRDAGFDVRLAPPVCCGRPLYDHGLLDRAGRYLDRLVTALAPVVDDGARLVVLEPSCLAVLRDELRQMRPDDPAATTVREASRDLGEFLVEVGYDLPAIAGDAIVHGHCHQKGVYGLDGLATTLDRTGLDWRELDAGCCGLAGSFGFEAGAKAAVAVAAGERKLLPAVRAADRDTLVLADGFSCATQIDHLQRRNGAGAAGPRRAEHLAEVLARAVARRRRSDAAADGPGSTRR